VWNRVSFVPVMPVGGGCPKSLVVRNQARLFGIAGSNPLVASVLCCPTALSPFPKSMLVVLSPLAYNSFLCLYARVE
jgi:hypothetical protein